jgi:hypothetical protein
VRAKLHQFVRVWHRGKRPRSETLAARYSASVAVRAERRCLGWRRTEQRWSQRIVALDSTQLFQASDRGPVGGIYFPGLVITRRPCQSLRMAAGSIYH